MCEAVAVLSDIHGNRWALEAVLEDMRRLGVVRAVNLGDALYGPLDPAGTADLLIRLDLPGVAGNQDRVIVDSTGEPSRPLHWVREQLADDHLEWLRSLPPTLVFEDMLLCHGTPACDSTYLLWDAEPTGPRSRTQNEIAETLSGVEQPIVLCGHDHVPRTVELADGRLVVNPGSVGLPAYVDDEPYPHTMESGSPHARYAVVRWAREVATAEIRTVSYDWFAAADAARRNGRPEWASWLTSGTAREAR